MHVSVFAYPIITYQVGHNMDLAHSGETPCPSPTTCEYEDQTGMMGYSYIDDDAPAMCFNNAKNWQIGE